MYMDKRDDYKQTIMNMETVLAKLLTLDHSMSEQQLDMQIPQLLEQIGEYTQSDRVYFFDWASPDCRIYRNTYEWCSYSDCSAGHVAESFEWVYGTR
mgnify:CR=1 FL=1